MLKKIRFLHFKCMIKCCENRALCLTNLNYYLSVWIFKNYPHLAGDGSLKKKKFKVFAFFSKKIFFFVVISLKLVKIIGVCEVNFFSKIEFDRFFSPTKYVKIKKIIQNLQRQKVVKNQF